MGVVLLKQDIQQAIANNVKEFQNSYKSLIFNEESKRHLKSLHFIEELKIVVDNNRLLYNIKINEEAIKSLTNEDMQKIQQIDFQSRVRNMFFEQLAECKLLNFKNIFQTEQKPPRKNKKLHEGQRIQIKIIQQILKDKFNIEAKLKESKIYLSLEADLQKLALDRDMLEELEKIGEEVSVLAIVPQFSDEYDDILGVRLFMGINLD